MLQILQNTFLWKSVFEIQSSFLKFSLRICLVLSIKIGDLNLLEGFVTCWCTTCPFLSAVAVSALWLTLCQSHTTNRLKTVLADCLNGTDYEQLLQIAKNGLPQTNTSRQLSLLELAWLDWQLPGYLTTQDIRSDMRCLYSGYLKFCSIICDRRIFVFLQALIYNY